MKRPRYTEEFKHEAVKQVVERGFTQKDVAANLGISQPNLFRWIKEYGEDRPYGNTKELDKDAEIVKLKAQLKRIEEERDIFKKPSVLYKQPSDLSL